MQLNTFVRKENGLIKEMTSSFSQSITGYEKIPNADDLDKLDGEALTTAMALVSEFDAYLSKTGEYSPENTMTYADKRRQPMAKGGYGTVNEQLEMQNEQGFSAWQAHCAQVKITFPKI